MHSVITEAQCVTNEKFNETLSMDQGQGLRRIMKSPISSRGMGCFSLLCGMLTESSIIMSATAGLPSRDGSDWSQKETLQINDSNHRSMSLVTAVVAIMLSVFFFRILQGYIFR